MLLRKFAGFLMLLTLAGCLSRQTNHLLPPAPEPPRMSSQQSSQPRDDMQILPPTSAGATALAREPAPASR